MRMPANDRAVYLRPEHEINAFGGGGDARSVATASVVDVGSASVVAGLTAAELVQAAARAVTAARHPTLSTRTRPMLSCEAPGRDAGAPQGAVTSSGLANISSGLANTVSELPPCVVNMSPWGPRARRGERKGGKEEGDLPGVRR